MCDDHHEVIVGAVKKLRHNDEVADFTIAAENGKEWKVHKLVLFMWSDVLYRMSTSKDFIEFQTGRIVLRDVGENAIAMMIDFIYLGQIEIDDYDFDFHTKPRLCAEVWQLADMYDIKSLKSRIEEIFEEWFIQSEEEVEIFRDAIRAVCESDVPDKMWQMMIEELAMAFDHRNSFTGEDIDSFLEIHPKLAQEVVKAISKTHSRGGRSSVPY